MSDIEAFVSTLKANLASYLKGELDQQADETLRDVNRFLDDLESDLRQWAEALGSRGMSLEDYESLVRGQSGLAKLVALKRLGIAQARLDELKEGIVDTLLNTVRSSTPM
jgi:uncharacterized protein YydD (DUF2326 family)